MVIGSVIIYVRLIDHGQPVVPVSVELTMLSFGKGIQRHDYGRQAEMTDYHIRSLKSVKIIQMYIRWVREMLSKEPT